MSRLQTLLALLKARHLTQEDLTSPDRQLPKPGGITPSQTVRDRDGQAWHLKTGFGDDQSHSEQLANAVYRAAKVHAPHTELVQGVPTLGNGLEPVYASKYVPDFKTLNAHRAASKTYPKNLWEPHGPDVAHRYLQGAAVDAFLATEDHHGGNVGVMTGRDRRPRPSRIDNGFSVFHSASRYAHAHEWGPSQAHLHALELVGSQHKSPLDHLEYLTPGLKQLDAVRQRHGSWQQFIDRALPSAPVDFRSKAAQQFETRHAHLHQLAGHLRSGGVRALFRPTATGPTAAPRAAATRPEALPVLAASPEPAPSSPQERLHQLRQRGESATARLHALKGRLQARPSDTP